MRTTVNLAEDALIAAQSLARRRRISLGEAVSELVRRGASTPAPTDTPPGRHTLRGRFALLPARDEIITTDHIRALMDQEVR
ncbi:MAG: hypothetical protein WCG13_08050 [Burkholderiales bacterium]|jgi:hypothetical protein